MCGRFILMLEAEELQSEYGLQQVPIDYSPRYNIAPSQPVLVIADWAGRRAEWMRWGLVPSWAKDPAIGNKMINARSETVQEKPSFRNAFQRRRCLIPMSGFYEWKRSAGKGPSTPYYFFPKDRGPIAFAGLWESWKPAEGDHLLTCTILTTSANGVVGQVHERMPVMLGLEDFPLWMGSGSPKDWQSLLRPFPDAKLDAYPVSRLVNSPDHDGPELVQPVIL